MALAEAINPIYQSLTKGNNYPLGGTAFLSLESNEEPYLHGIKYTAMPPLKRFREMEQVGFFFLFFFFFLLPFIFVRAK